MSSFDSPASVVEVFEEVVVGRQSIYDRSWCGAHAVRPAT